MNPKDYHQFTDTLIASLTADERVLGLVAAGSMAGTNHQPDAWSDHDFWIVTVPGAQEHFRTVYDWLPDAAGIVFAMRETGHGLKALYESGHLIEYAVFDPDELTVTRINAYRLLLDRADIAARLDAVRARTVEWSQSQRSDDGWLFGQFLTNLWVGVGRHRRGEKLSGHSFVKNQGIGHLLPLLVKHAPTERADLLDDIDPLRRFSFAFPELGAEINSLLLLETPACALGLLDLADRLLADRLPDYPAVAVAVIRRVIMAGA